MNKSLPAAFGAVVLLFLVSACGGTSGNAAEQDPGQSQQSTRPQGGSGQGFGFPGANGEVAAVSGSTMQVQSKQAGQVAVTWTAKTTFTQQVKASLVDVSVGECVMVSSAGDGSSNSTVSTTIQADEVSISKPVDGSCAPTATRGNAPAPQDAPSDLPTDVPSDLPSGGPSAGGPGRAGGIFGTVTAVTSDGFTVESAAVGAPGMPGSPASDSASASASSAKTTIAVTTTSDTSFTTTAVATAKAVEVGVCVQARGDEDDTGAVTAETVAVSSKVDGQCGGFGPAGADGPAA